ncbi:hypothetical protein OS493_040274, partial [Desmophyllum pertusum]
MAETGLKPPTLKKKVLALLTTRPPHLHVYCFFEVSVISTGCSMLTALRWGMSREFSGSGYLKYDIISKNPVINSDEDTLKFSFRTFQPTGMFFHTQNSGNELGDYITLELVGGRL